jgi:hypothetical protein
MGSLVAFNKPRPSEVGRKQNGLILKKAEKFLIKSKKRGHQKLIYVSPFCFRRLPKDGL